MYCDLPCSPGESRRCIKDKSCTCAVALCTEMATGASEGHLQCGMKSSCPPLKSLSV